MRPSSGSSTHWAGWRPPRRPQPPAHQCWEGASSTREPPAPGGCTCSQPAFSYTFLSLIPSYTGHENLPSTGGRGLPAACSSLSPAGITCPTATSLPADQFEFAVLDGEVKMQRWGIHKVFPRGRGTWALRRAHGTRTHKATARRGASKRYLQKTA